MQPCYVVLDWGVIRTLSKTTVIPNDWQLLLPDIIFHEIIDVEPPDDPCAFWRKMLAFMESNRSRIWGADYWVFVAKKYEKDFERRARLKNVIDRRRTRALRKAQPVPDAKLSQHIEAFRKTPFCAAYKKEQCDFVEFCDRCAKFIQDKNPPHDAPQQIRWIQNPDLVAQLITSPSKLSARFPRMRVRHVTGFPDRWAIARWTRITMWYALQRWKQGSNPSTDFENNFDDAQYLFLASYAGHIATRDSGLKKAVGVLFPGCCVVDF
jgi:hypothetical protein